jgi:hypothetical protein
MKKWKRGIQRKVNGMISRYGILKQEEEKYDYKENGGGQGEFVLRQQV